MNIFVVPLLGLLVTIACSYFSYLDSSNKNKRLLLVLTILAASITAFTSVTSGISNKKSQDLLARWQRNSDSLSVTTHKYVTGGDVIPHITFGPSGESTNAYSFYMMNLSKDLSLFDLETTYIEVTADPDHLVYDAWAPQRAARINALQPHTSVELTDAPLHDFIEGVGAAYNFFTVSRNGYFREQMVIRLVGSERKCVYRIFRDDSLIYTSPIPERFLQAGEIEIDFPLPDEGLDKRLGSRHQRKLITRPQHDSVYVRNIASVTGVWQSQDSIKRFTVVFDGDQRSCGFYERNKHGEEMKSQCRISYLPHGDIEISRQNDDASVLNFLGFRPSLVEDILENEPDPSYLVLSFTADQAIGKWNGISIKQNKDFSLRELIQPDDNKVKVFHFKRIARTMDEIRERFYPTK